jgi:uncharacterized protein
MKKIPRILNLENLLQKKSYFLLGPRQTGKSFLIRETLQQYKSYNLLDNEIFLKLSQNPKIIEQELSDRDKIIIIDEIQKLPGLLDEVHRLIEEKNLKFLLTGSSARKLRRGGANLLGGRARTKYLHPLIYKEIENNFELNKALNIGLIPSIYLSDEPILDLKSYISNYLKEEIANEALTRNIPAFSRFLQIAALFNSQIINFSNIANDSQVPRTTVQEYFQILKDTLVAYEVPVWKKSIKRKPIATSKFYFFDIGVTRNLQGRQSLHENSKEYGEAFETFIANELKAFLDYTEKGELCYWRSSTGNEVDFIINDDVAIEVKSKTNINEKDLKGLMALEAEKQIKNFVVVCKEKTQRKINNITILPWDIFLNQLWSGYYT